jgi:hypothetical protein
MNGTRQEKLDSYGEFPQLLKSMSPSEHPTGFSITRLLCTRCESVNHNVQKPDTQASTRLRITVSHLAGMIGAHEELQHHIVLQSRVPLGRGYEEATVKVHGTCLPQFELYIA